MYEDYIELLIDSIHSYDEKYHPPYFILLYLPANDDYDRHDDMYFAALAAMIKPTATLLDEILFETKKQLGNIVYAAEIEILTKDDAIKHLEALLN